MKIAVLGYSGSGKSTLAKFLSVYYEIPLLYLDAVQFKPGWGERDRAEAASIVSEFMQNESWVIDGNYTSFLQAERLSQADYIVYMAFSRVNCLFRVLNRYIKNKNLCRESMADGCIEKIDFEFIRWVLYEGRTRDKRRHYEGIAQKYREKVVILKNQRELDGFMAEPFKGCNIIKQGK